MNRDELPTPAPPAEVPPEAHSGLMARFRNYFLTGLVVAGPVAITFYLTWWFVNWVDSLVRPFVPIAYRPETYLPFGLPGSGLIVAVSGIFSGIFVVTANAWMNAPAGFKSVDGKIASTVELGSILQRCVGCSFVQR